MSLKLEKIFSPLCFKIAIVIATLLTSVPFLHTYLGSYVKVVLIYGIITAIVALIRNGFKFIFKNKLNIVLILFCVSYAITILLNFHSNLSAHVNSLVYMAVFFFYFVMLPQLDGKDKLCREFKLISQITIVITFVFSFTAFLTYVFLISVKYIAPLGISYIGMSEHRLWGIYNANTGATLNALSIFLSVPLISRKSNTGRGFRIFCIINDILQFLCLVLTGSRAPFYALVLAGAVLAAILAYKSGAKSKLYAFGKSALSCVLIAVVLLSGSKISKYILSYVPMLAEGSDISERITAALESSDPDSFEPMEIEYPDAGGRYDLTRIEKTEDRNEGFFNGRSDLWQAGLKAFVKAPIFGIGRENIYEKAAENLHESRWAVNMRVGGLHNIYVTILVSSGIVGFLLMAIVAIGSAISIIKCLVKASSMSIFMPCAAVITLYFYITEFVEARILYQVSIFNVLFWLILGFAYVYSRLPAMEASEK